MSPAGRIPTQRRVPRSDRGEVAACHRVAARADPVSLPRQITEGSGAFANLTREAHLFASQPGIHRVSLVPDFPVWRRPGSRCKYPCDNTR